MSLVGEFFIPKFISAASPRGLRRAMLLNNRRQGKSFKYFQIMRDGKKWIAWYYDEETDPVELASVDREVLIGD